MKVAEHSTYLLNEDLGTFHFASYQKERTARKFAMEDTSHLIFLKVVVLATTN